MDLVPCKVHLCFSWSVFDGFELIRIFGRAVGRGGASRRRAALRAAKGRLRRPMASKLFLEKMIKPESLTCWLVISSEEEVAIVCNIRLGLSS